MKIGICCYPSYGGSGVVATELGIHLAKRGHEVHFITYDKPFRLGEYHPNVYYHAFDTPNYPVFKHPPYIMALANKIYEIAKRESLDILHAHYAVPHATAVFLAKQMLGGNIKTVTTLHGTVSAAEAKIKVQASEIEKQNRIIDGLHDQIDKLHGEVNRLLGYRKYLTVADFEDLERSYQESLDETREITRKYG